MEGKKMKHNRIHQKVLAIFLSFALVFGILQTAGLSAFAAESGGVTAYYNDSGLFKDSNYNQPVNDDAYLQTITQVVVENSTAKIGDNAFEGCCNLTEISIPASVTSIGELAFFYCGNLRNVTFGAGSRLGSIGRQAFFQCGALTEITLPDSVMSIGDNAFNSCKNLKRMALPEGLTSVGTDLFSGCNSLTSVTIPRNLSSIADNISSLQCCRSLEEINVEQGNANYFSYDGVLYTIGTDGAQTLSFCPTAKAGVCTVKAGTTAIGDFAFENCAKLTDITLPESLITIEPHVFQYCKGLTRIDLPKNVTNVGRYLFYGCTGLKELTVSENTTFEDGAVNGETTRNLYVIGTEDTDHNSPPCSNKFYFTKSEDGSTYQFHSYQGTKVGAVIPTELYGKPISPAIQESDLTVTPVTAYYNGSGLFSNEACTAPIGYDSRCTVTNVDMSSATEINDSAFNGCSSLTNITIPAGVAAINSDAFSDCSSLQKITVEPGNQNFCSHDRVLYQNETSGKLSLLRCPVARTGKFEICADTDTIENYAFAGCTGLTDVTIPAGVTQIWAGAFDSCTGLTNVAIPSGVTEIGEYAFARCTGLTDVTIPSGVTEIGEYTFYGCTGLTDVTIPSGVTEIG